MKRIFIILISLIIILLPSCQSKQQEKPKDDNKQQVMKIDSKQAKLFMDNYLRYLLKGDTSSLSGYYSDKFKQSIKEVKPQQNPRPVAFKIEDAEVEKNKVEFKVTIFNAGTNSPYYSADFFKYIVIIDKDNMFIDSIEKENSIEIYEQDKTLFKRDKDSGVGNKIFTIKDMPTFVYSKQAIREQKYKVEQSKLGPCAVTDDGKSILVSSIGKNSYVGYIQLSDSKETFNITQGEEKKDESGSKEGEGQAEEGKDKEEEKSKLKFNIKDIDYYFASTVSNVIFSPEGKNILVEVTDMNGMSYINLYKNTGEVIDLKLEEKFEKGKFSLTKPYFVSENEVVFSVIPYKNATDEEKKLMGDWMINIEKIELTQLK